MYDQLHCLQLVCVSSYLSMPNNPKTDLGVLTVWLQVRTARLQRTCLMGPAVPQTVTGLLSV